jgi:hypothetical protein
VRTKPLIGRKAWFGPRRVGWGLGPATAEGWVVVAIGAAAVIVLAVTVQPARWLGIIAAAVFLAVVILKGTSPGGHDDWLEFKASRSDNDPAA